MGRHRDAGISDQAPRRLGRPRALNGAVEGCGQRVYVCPRALLLDTIGVVLLDRREASLDEGGQSLGPLADGLPSRAEVDQAGRAVGADNDVVGGDVAVQEVRAVHHLERVEQRAGDQVELILRRRTAEAFEPLAHGLA